MQEGRDPNDPGYEPDAPQSSPHRTDAVGYSACQPILPNVDMATDLDLLVGAGITNIGLAAQLVERTGVGETIELLAQRGMGVSSLMPNASILGPSAEQFDATTRRQLRLAAKVGAPNLLLVSGPLPTSTSTAEADREMRRRLREMTGLADELGVKLALEPTHPFLRQYGYVHTLRHAAEIVEENASAAVTLDMLHVFWDRNLERDIPEFVGLLANVQLSDLDRQALAARTWDRTNPGEGLVAVGELVDCLHLAGYRGYYENEVIHYAARPFDPEQTARIARDVKSVRL